MKTSVVRAIVEADISGASADYRALAELVEHGEGQLRPIEVAVTPSFDGALSGIDIRRSVGRVKIYTDCDLLAIEGSPDLL